MYKAGRRQDDWRNWVCIVEKSESVPLYSRECWWGLLVVLMVGGIKVGTWEMAWVTGCHLLIWGTNSKAVRIFLLVNEKLGFGYTKCRCRQVELTSRQLYVSSSEEMWKIVIQISESFVRILVVFKSHESVMRSLYHLGKKTSLHKPPSHSNFIHSLTYPTHI